MENQSARTDRLQGLAMIAVLAFGLWQGGAALLTPAAQRQFDGKLTVAALLAGRTAGAVNTIMAHDLPTDRLWRGIGGALRYRLFNSGGPQVWVGDHGWLYLTEELRPWPDADASMTRRARIVHDVAARLRAKGIDLLVTLVPDKARIAPATLGSAPRAEQTLTRYATFVTRLKEQGVAIVPLDHVLAGEGEPYLRTDTHWSQQGAAHAAIAIARANTTVLPDPVSYQTTTDAAQTEAPGDLLHLMSLDILPSGWAPLLRPRPDLQHAQHTVPLAPLVAADAGLLDETPAVPVALVGSSFSLNANFSGRLEEALHAEVTNVAKLGGGFAGAAADYIKSPAFLETPPLLVIWEIPERVVGQPISEADRDLEAWAAAK